MPTSESEAIKTTKRYNRIGIPQGRCPFLNTPSKWWRRIAQLRIQRGFSSPFHCLYCCLKICPSEIGAGVSDTVRSSSPSVEPQAASNRTFPVTGAAESYPSGRCSIGGVLCGVIGCEVNGTAGGVFSGRFTLNHLPCVRVHRPYGPETVMLTNPHLI